MANQLVRHRRACAHRAAADARATFWVEEPAHFAREFACGSLALTLTQTSEGGERRRSGGMTDTHPGLKMHILCFSSVWRSLGGWQRAKVGIRERERLVGGAGKHAAIRK